MNELTIRLTYAPGDEAHVLSLLPQAQDTVRELLSGLRPLAEPPIRIAALGVMVEIRWEPARP